MQINSAHYTTRRVLIAHWQARGSHNTRHTLLEILICPHIRELTLGDEPLSLQFLQCTGLVLPNLRAVRWRCPPFPTPISEPRVDSIVFLWPLLSPDIVTLEVLLKSPDDPNYHLFLENYPSSSLCPNLKSHKFKFISWLQSIRRSRRHFHELSVAMQTGGMSSFLLP